jgi:hypothetical protein
VVRSSLAYIHRQSFIHFLVCRTTTSSRPPTTTGSVPRTSRWRGNWRRTPFGGGCSCCERCEALSSCSHQDIPVSRLWRMYDGLFEKRTSSKTYQVCLSFFIGFCFVSLVWSMDVVHRPRTKPFQLSSLLTDSSQQKTYGRTPLLLPLR